LLSYDDRSCYDYHQDDIVHCHYLFYQGIDHDDLQSFHNFIGSS
jgi:hypothetical protein